jgi:hypothetical protein
VLWKNQGNYIGKHSQDSPVIHKIFDTSPVRKSEVISLAFYLTFLIEAAGPKALRCILSGFCIKNVSSAARLFIRSTLRWASVGFNAIGLEPTR